MRLGLYPAALKEGSVVRAAYGEAPIEERHRHRYEVNNAYRDQLEEAGLVFSGTSPDNNLVEFVELPRDVHPYYVATQAHPELRSRPTRPHPLFAGLVGAAIERQKELRFPIDETGLRREIAEAEDVSQRCPSSPTHDELWPVAVQHRPVPRRLGRRAARRPDPPPRRTPTGEPFRRLVLEHPGAAVVLALDDQRPGALPAAVPARGAAPLVELPAGLLRRAGGGPARGRAARAASRRPGSRRRTGRT